MTNLRKNRLFFSKVLPKFIFQSNKSRVRLVVKIKNCRGKAREEVQSNLFPLLLIVSLFLNYFFSTSTWASQCLLCFSA